MADLPSQEELFYKRIEQRDCDHIKVTISGYALYADKGLFEVKGWHCFLCGKTHSEDIPIDDWRPRKPMKIYIAGPMAGLPGMNFEAFNQKDYELRLLGHETVNPVDIGEKFFSNNLAVHPTKYLKMDIIELLSCDAICLLPGWLDSRGARIEAAIAKMMGFAFIDGETNQPMSPPDKVCIASDYRDWHPPETSHGT